MKSLFCFGTLLLAGALAHADLIVEQTLESQFMNGAVTMKLKGDKARIETPSPLGGQSITIIDATTNKMTTLLPTQKMAMEMDTNAIRKQAQAAAKGNGTDPAALKPVATGQKQKIGDWNAEEYTVSTGGDKGMTMHLWVASDFPEGKAYKDQMAKFSKAFAQGGLDPNSLNLPGMVVKSDVDSPLGKISTTLKSVKEAPVPDSDFIIPGDYQKMPMPGALGGAK